MEDENYKENLKKFNNFLDSSIRARKQGEKNHIKILEFTGISQMKGRERTRMLARIRDKFTCQDCGLVRTPKTAKKINKRLFDIHHLKGKCGKKSRGYDKISDLKRLITLCHKCHFNRHDFGG